MKRLFGSGLILPALLLLLANCSDESPAVGTTQATVVAGTPFNGIYIVTLRPGASPLGVANAVGAAPLHVYSHAINGFAAPLPPQAIAALANNPNVLLVEPDQEVTASAQTTPTGINRMDVARAPGVSLNGVDDENFDVDVAVLDTGIQPDHPDLDVVGGVNCSRGTSWADGNGHGTHVAGTIGALDNGIGVVGVAPGTRLWAVRVLDNRGSGSWSSIICGIDWVKQNAATIDVANMSLGGSGTDGGGSCASSSMHQAICNAVAAGVPFVVAAGNESSDSANFVPAAYDEVITVAALADFDGAPGRLGTGSFAFSSCTESVDDSFACFSNFGADVDVMAPGVGIYSTVLGSGYGSKSGTSMASPHVAGVAALYLARNPSATPADVRGALIAAGDTTPCGAGEGARCTDDGDLVQEPLTLAGAGCSTDAGCDDGSACTTDTCNVATGTCAYAAVSCDDGNACTSDTCEPATGCTGATTSCDDGNACTTDTCDPLSGCSSTALTCDDANACTTDACDPTIGCAFIAVSCNDGNACTADACDPTSGCLASPITCDDGLTCTTDSCDPVSGCLFTTAGCDDGNACTADACDISGGCTSSLISCDDGNTCTDDSCDFGAGCQSTPNTAGCDDGNACTTNDSCSGGACSGSAPVSCDDGNACTSNSCDPTIGCTASPVSCNDQNACTVDLCDPTSGCASTPVSCDDGNSCTVDSCVPTTGVCTYTNTCCKPVGDRCTSDVDCCAGKCRGPSNNKTCKAS